MYSASPSKYCSCVIAAYRMIYSFNLSVYLYQLVVTFVICWLPVNKQYLDEVCIMYNTLKGVETSRVFFKTQLFVSVVNALVLVR
jgi:hypothetical protein